MLDVGGLREWLKLGTIAAFSFCLGIALSVAQQSWLHLSTPLWIAACVGLSVLYLYAIGQVLEILDHGESVDFVFIAALVWLLAFVFGLIVLPLVSGLYDLVETMAHEARMMSDGFADRAPTVTTETPRKVAVPGAPPLHLLVLWLLAALVGAGWLFLMLRGLHSCFFDGPFDATATFVYAVLCIPGLLFIWIPIVLYMGHGYREETPSEVMERLDENSLYLKRLHVNEDLERDIPSDSIAQVSRVLEIKRGIGVKVNNLDDLKSIFEQSRREKVAADRLASFALQIAVNSNCRQIKIAINLGGNPLRSQYHERGVLFDGPALSMATGGIFYGDITVTNATKSLQRSFSIRKDPPQEVRASSVGGYSFYNVYNPAEKMIRDEIAIPLQQLCPSGVRSGY